MDALEERHEKIDDLNNYVISENINICYSLRTSSPEKIKTSSLLELIKKHNPVLFEFFNAQTTEIRPHFDFDFSFKEYKKEITEYKDFEALKNDTFKNIYILMIKYFNNSNFAVSEDCRYNSSTDYKISYHFVLINRKIKMEDLKTLSNYLKKTDLKNYGLDTSIYRTGLSKFRCVLCKKNKDFKTYLKPLNFQDNIDYHLVQCVEGLKYFDLELITNSIDIGIKHVSLDNNIEEKNADLDFKNEDFEPEKLDKLIDYLKEVNKKGNEYFNNESTRPNLLQMFIIKCYRPILNKDELMEKMICLIKSISVIRKGETSLYFNYQKIVSFVDRYYDKDITISTGKIISCLKEYNIYDGIKHLFEKLGSDDKCFKFKTFNNINKDFKNQNYKIEDNKKSNFLILLKYFERFNFKIINPTIFVSLNDNKIESLKTKKDFKISYEDLYFTKSEIKNNIETLEKKKFIESWFEYSEKRRYDKIDFLPGEDKIIDNIYNSFNGLRIENINVPDFDKKDILPKIDLVNHQMLLLSGNDTLCFDYIINYFAYVFQNLGQVPGVALLFRSEKQGVGKNLTFENFIGKIIGKEYYGLPNSIDDMIGRFTSALENKIMLINDETSGKESFSANDKIKKLITANYIDIEHKGVKAYTVKHSAFYVLFSNNDTPIKVEQSDRRFMVFDCDCSMAGNTKYFKELNEAYTDVRVQKYFYDLFMKKDLTDFDIINSRPETDFYKSLKESTIPMIIYFLNDLTNKFYKNKYFANELFNIFKSWCSDTNHNNIYTSTKFGREIKKYLKHNKTSKGIEYLINEDIKNVINRFIK